MRRSLPVTVLLAAVLVGAAASASAVSVASPRGGDAAVITHPSYDYVATIMTFPGGVYRAWWCGQVRPSHDAVYSASSSSMTGGWSTPLVQFWNSSSSANFDGTHVCDPSVLRVNATYYMYYGGEDNGDDANTQIGVATSPDGTHWSRANGGRPIVAPQSFGRTYGAGQPSVVYLDGYFYMIYNDSTGNGGDGQYVVRSPDPLFQAGVQVFTGSGFAPRTAANATAHMFIGAHSVDWMYSDVLHEFVIANDSSRGGTQLIFYSKDLRTRLSDTQSIPGTWDDGPGLTRRSDGHVPFSSAWLPTLPIDILRGCCAQLPPSASPEQKAAVVATWDLAYSGADVVTGVTVPQYHLVAKHSGMCMDVTGNSTSDGARLQQWDCRSPADAPNQIFSLVQSSGGFAQLVAKNSGKCVDVSGASQATQATLQQYTCLGQDQPNQLWRFVSTGDGYGRLIAKHSGQCADVTGAGFANGAAIQQYTCLSTAANQRWKLQPIAQLPYHLVAKHSGKCMDVTGNSTSDGARLQQWDCRSPADAPNQIFVLVQSSGGYVQLVAKNSGKCVDVSGASTAPQAALQQYSCLGPYQPNQLWRFVSTDDGYGRLIAKHSGQCADVTGASFANGAAIQQYTCLSTAANQRWKLQPVS